MDKRVTSNAAAKSASLSSAAVTENSEVLRRLLADAFCLYLKTKNFHWHMTGSPFRDYHLLLEEASGSSVRDGGCHCRTRA
jgi:starvation-inducible DNA-binding protein